MNCKRFYIFCFVALFALSASSQPETTVEEYIAQYKDLAIEEMEKYRIPASITLAQGILESDCGNSPLAKEANNHFGIKCHKEWTGNTFHQDDDEENECFRKYHQAGESYRDHSEFLTSRDRYHFLFDLDPADYKGWAYGLKQAGYATNPRYPELLIKIIEENGLDRYDKVDGRKSLVSSQKPAISSQRSAVGDQNPELTFEICGRGGNDRIIFLNNGVKFILASDGDDYYQIASEFAIYAWQLFVYNDAEKDNKVTFGQKVYLEKKKRRAEFDQHVVREGENLYSISQDYGIRLKSLCRMNFDKCGEKLSVGDVVKLR